MSQPTYLDMNGDDIRECRGMTLDLTRAELIELDVLTAYYLETGRRHYRDTEDLDWWINSMIMGSTLMRSAHNRYDIADLSIYAMLRVYGI